MQVSLLQTDDPPRRLQHHNLLLLTTSSTNGSAITLQARCNRCTSVADGEKLCIAVDLWDVGMSIRLISKGNGFDARHTGIGRHMAQLRARAGQIFESSVII